MVRTAAGRGVMRSAIAHSASVSSARFRAVYTTEPVALHIEDRRALALPASTLAWSDDAADERWHLTAVDRVVTLRAWWLEFSPNDASIAVDARSL